MVKRAQTDKLQCLLTRPEAVGPQVPSRDDRSEPPRSVGEFRSE